MENNQEEWQRLYLQWSVTAAAKNPHYLENQPGAPFRAALNKSNELLLTLNASSKELDYKVAGMFWQDTSKPKWILKRRNENNTAWHTVYDSSNKPTKAVVGLSLVANFAYTHSLTDGSTEKYFTAKGAKDLDLKKLDKGAKAADSAKLGGILANKYALQNGIYPGLRAQGTTQADVGLSKVQNNGTSSSTTLNDPKTNASSKAVFDLNGSKLGKTEKAVDSAKFGGLPPASYAKAVHSHKAEQLPKATTKAFGISKLNSSITSQSETESATPKAIFSLKTWLHQFLCPPGMIVDFAGTEKQIPKGWQLCNGIGKTSNGIPVPDLRNRFVIGACGKYQPGAKGGSETATSSLAGAHDHQIVIESGGEHDHEVVVDSRTLGEEQGPKHKHQVPKNSSNGGDEDTTFKTATGGSRGRPAWVYEAGGSKPHNHTATSKKATHGHSSSSKSNGNHSHKTTILPTYYALCRIIKL